MEREIKFINYKIKIKILTGTHIGAGNEDVGIGGVDNKIIRTYWKKGEEIDKVPIIPGSSIKGKVRSFMEIENKWHENGEILDKSQILKKLASSSSNRDNRESLSQEEKYFIAFYKVFGVGAKEIKKEDQENIKKDIIELIKSLGAGRAIFSDLYPTEETLQWWREREDLFEYAEVKAENTINRSKGTANPRFQERIPAGSEFEGTITLQIYPEDREFEDEMEKLIKEKIPHILNNTYIGGSGTRGYGRVEVTISPCKEEESIDDRMKKE